MAKLGKTSETVLRVIAKLKESHLHELNAELGFDTRSTLRSLIGCDLIEVVRTVTRKSTKGHLVEINVYGITEKGIQKLHLIDNPPTPIEQPTAVAKASNAIKRTIESVQPVETKQIGEREVPITHGPCNQYEVYKPERNNPTNYVPRPIRGILS